MHKDHTGPIINACLSSAAMCVWTLPFILMPLQPVSITVQQRRSLWTQLSSSVSASKAAKIKVKLKSGSLFIKIKFNMPLITHVALLQINYFWLLSRKAQCVCSCLITGLQEISDSPCLEQRIMWWEFTVRLSCKNPPHPALSSSALFIFPGRAEWKCRLPLGNTWLALSHSHILC